ncbi:hypothetical protein PGT21_033007 [Puccinia graminis f. sp. tritici]|uniref:Uncharacterized protein n=1 Tax=Puccinia graminis f. sp. tritici TaxID=56615 RepID=A0A5B0P2K0_PUCGR|nr:hypothetical protein PGTUg99_008058 [Puccinia graminis f. sp. tritici]KAA1094934.1 hypothetical protein PGT21_033007 [Puccinia graminis f. sp. tritici]
MNAFGRTHHNHSHMTKVANEIYLPAKSDILAVAQQTLPHPTYHPKPSQNRPTLANPGSPTLALFGEPKIPLSHCLATRPAESGSTPQQSRSTGLTSHTADTSTSPRSHHSPHHSPRIHHSPLTSLTAGLDLYPQLILFQTTRSNRFVSSIDTLSNDSVESRYVN